MGFAWIEIGGDAAALSRWVGDALPVRHVGGRSGPHAVGVSTAGGVIEVRLT